MRSLLLILVVALAATAAAERLGAHAPRAPPNILLIIGDDLGFNDVSFRGSNQIPTPNIDALAFSGMVLDRHYVLPTCTPSRTALLTGQYPIRTGMQGFPLKAGEPRALPLELRTLPEHLTTLGYQTYLIGKWHLGFYRSEFTPTRRGFHHHLGYWNGYISYFSHDVALSVSDALDANRIGIDMHWDNQPAWGMQGRYATHLFTEHAEDVIARHDPAAGPLYLQIAHLAAHSGLNGTELEVPDEAENDRRHGYITNNMRKHLAGVIREMDLSVGRVIQALNDKGILNNTLIVFISDNGAETEGIHRNVGSNWPLRGQKWTVYDGGVRGAAAVWSPMLSNPHSIHKDLMHITDWLPTFYEAAGGNVSDLGPIDGVSQWKALTGNSMEATRSEVLVQIDQAGAIIQDNWKLVRGELYREHSGYVGDSGQDAEVPTYDADAVVSSPAAQALRAATSPASRLTASTVLNLRARASLPASCRPDDTTADPLDLSCEPYCLFDVLEDPCESVDVSAENKDVGDRLLSRLQYWESLTVPQLNTEVDLAADPRLHNMTWVPWKDDLSCSSSGSALSPLPFHVTLVSIMLLLCLQR